MAGFGGDWIADVYVDSAKAVMIYSLTNFGQYFAFFAIFFPLRRLIPG